MPPLSAPFEPRHARVIVRRSRRAQLGLTFGLLVLGGVLGMLGSSWSFLPFLAAIVAGSMMRALPPRVRSGVVAVTADGLSVDGVVVHRLDALGQAVAYPRTRGVMVRIQPAERWGMPLDVELASDVEAHELLVAIAKDSGRATASFYAVRGGLRRAGREVWLRRVAFGCLAGLGGILPLWMQREGHSLPTILLVSAILGPMLAALWSLSTIVLVVGADGVLVRSVTRWFRRAAFYPYRDLQHVARDRNDVVLQCASGEVIRFSFPEYKVPGGGQERPESPAHAFFARMTEARARCLSGESSDLAGALARGERDPVAWRESLEAMLGGPRSYRTAAVPPERLWRVLEDPTQPEETRAGAVVALRPAIDEAGKTRLRVATEACASAKLRAALEAATVEDEGALERALEAIHNLPRARGARS